MAFFTRTTWGKRHQKGKPFLILLEQEMMMWQWHQLDHMLASTCIFAPCSRETTTPASHHSVFTGRMPFLPPDQQRQSTEGIPDPAIPETFFFGGGRGDSEQLESVASIRCEYWRPTTGYLCQRSELTQDLFIDSRMILFCAVLVTASAAAHRPSRSVQQI